MTFPVGPLTSVAVIDAILSGVEGLMRFPKPSVLDGFNQHTMEPRHKAGFYSDDTQHTDAMTDWVMRVGEGQNISDRDLALSAAEALVTTFGNNRRGGSPRMNKALDMVLCTGKPLEECLPEKTEGSGAAMRASVFGLLPDQGRMLRLVKIQAGVTHRDSGIRAAEAAALMTYFMVRGCHKNDLRRKVADVLGDEDFYPIALPKGPIYGGMKCVLAALLAIESTDGFNTLTQFIADMGGDSDTIGVIAMGAVWMSPQFKNDWKDYFWWGLEYEGLYGRDYLRRKELACLKYVTRLVSVEDNNYRQFLLRAAG